jgi:capsular polysaccharide transport system permease protein
MTISKQNNHKSIQGRLMNAWNSITLSLFSLTLFRQVLRLIFVLALVVSVYWLTIASNRYVSEANVIIQKTDQISGTGFDIASMIGVGGIGGPNRADQLLLREYLLSVDMLKKLDTALDLRSHYSGWRRDPVSNMWFKDASMEWFHRYYLSRVSVDYDDFAGVLRIKVQAYDPKTAQAIASVLVQEGERYMNQIGHELAEVQVTFLTTQVNLAQQRFLQASQALLSFQNKKGLVSPQATAESISAIIANLEGQRTEYQTQLASLPRSLDKNHPNILMIKQAIEAVERQIAQEKAKLTSTSVKSLNYTVEEFERMKMEVNFTQDIYKTALVALEKGRMDATRTLKKVSVLQTPSLPEYPMEPGRIYNTVVTLLFAAMLAGIVKMLEGIVRDHVD